MNKEKIKELKNELEDSLKCANEMFEKKIKSHAFIIGWLEGIIKQTIKELEKELDSLK